MKLCNKRKILATNEEIMHLMQKSEKNANLR